MTKNDLRKDITLKIEELKKIMSESYTSYKERIKYEKIVASYYVALSNLFIDREYFND